MKPHRMHRFPSTVSLSLLCGALALGGCTINMQSGSGPAKTAQGHHPSKPGKKTEPKKTEPKKTEPKKTEPKRTEQDKPAESGKPVVENPKSTEPEKDPEPTREDRPLKPGYSRLILPVSVPFKDVKEKLDEDLPKHETRDWKRVTKEGKRHEVDVRYEIWRDPIQLSMKGRTIRAKVPVRYASEFRAKVKKPIGKGSIWLTHGETWGTKEHPQEMEVTIDLTLDISDNYELKSESKLVSIKHGEPPEGKACVKVGIEICTPKKELASYVEDELSERVAKKIEKLLKKGDKKISKLFDLRGKVEQLWEKMSVSQELQKPNDVNCPTSVGEVCSKSAWFTLEPKELELSPLGLDHEDLGVRVGIEGRLRITTEPPKVKPAKLPKLERIDGGSRFELATSLDIPFERLKERLDKALANTPIRTSTGSVKFKSATVALHDGAAKTVKLELVTESDEHLGFESKLDFDIKKGIFVISSLVPNAQAQALIEKSLKGLDLDGLKNMLAERASVSLKQASQSLREALTRALSKSIPGKLQAKGSLDEASLEDFSLSSSGIAVKVSVSGPLKLEYSVR